MKVAFVAPSYDPRDVSRGSGTFYYMTREIEYQNHSVHYLGPIEVQVPIVTRVLQSFHRRIGKRYKRYLDPFFGKAVGRAVTERLDKLEYDLLITNDFAVAAFARIKKPIVVYTDVMIPLNYPENVLPEARIANLSPIGVALFQKTIKRGLSQANLCIFPIQATANEALKYHPHPTKIKVISFGANIDDPGPQTANNRSFSKIIQKGLIDFLFIGKEWTRKGGDIAVNVVAELRKRGSNVNLNIVGTVPPYSIDEDYIKVYGILDKSIASDRRVLDNLFRMCDILILPSKSEGFGIVFVEAAAYGLPSLAYNTTGVATAVRDGESGILLELGQSAAAFADVVESWFKDPSLYDKLVLLSRKHFEKTVNWKTAVSTLFSEVDKILSNNSREVSLGKLKSLKKNGSIIND